jgi:hypothetical protein
MPAVKTITETEAKSAERSFQGAAIIRRIQYEIAIDSVDAAIRKQGRFTLGAALSSAMATLNRAQYKNVDFDNGHYESICSVLDSTEWKVYRNRKLSDLTDADEKDVFSIFSQFESVLGVVGASKALNLLAPEFFPIWTPPIAKAYGYQLFLVPGTKAHKYWQFMKLSRPHHLELKQFLADPSYPLLIILHEHNYRKYCKKAGYF